MIRKIKFRAYHLKEAQKIYPVFQICWGWHDCSAMKFGDFVQIKYSYNCPSNWIPMEEVVLMQYTGLKDVEGKEIFEGDIIKGRAGKPRKVIYHAGRFMHSSHSKRGERKPLYAGVVYHREFKVIGNIYLNAELLGGNNAKG